MSNLDHAPVEEDAHVRGNKSGTPDSKRRLSLVLEEIQISISAGANGPEECSTARSPRIREIYCSSQAEAYVLSLEDEFMISEDVFVVYLRNEEAPSSHKKKVLMLVPRKSTLLSKRYIRLEAEMLQTQMYMDPDWPGCRELLCRSTIAKGMETFASSRLAYLS